MSDDLAPPGSMRAAVPDQGTVALVRTSVPTPGPGQVLVEVRAAAMNRADLLHARGRYGQRAFASASGPDIAGMELAGVVRAVGAGVADHAPGDRVMAMTARAYADFAVVDARLLLPVPDDLDWNAAAALPMGLLTETEALVRLAATRPGERVLVLGATTGVGLLGVQVARSLAPEVLVGTTRSTDGAALLAELGADHVARTVEEVAPLAGDGFDVVIDHVGGEWTEAALACLRQGARVVSVGRMGERTANVDLTALAGKRASLIGTTWKTQELEQIADTVAVVRERVLPAVRDRRIRSIVSATLELDDITDGYRRLATARRPGKLVVVVSRD